jgi:3-dehydroquinate synthase
VSAARRRSARARSIPARAAHQTVRVRLPGRSYPILIGPGLLSRLGSLLSKTLPGRDLLVVADARVLRLHGATLRESLSDFSTAIVSVRPGEPSKSLINVERLYQGCRRHGLGRDGAIVAFGGGVIGDLGGFVAATYLRGLPLVMVPTSLLAQVDSSVGGKVGVNFGGLKNLVGAFHQPRLVVADTDLLATLPPREFRSALAEIIKYGMIADRTLFRLVEQNADDILGRNPELLCRIIARCCRIKARIVAADERENGLREILNYGHTLGHAFEAAARGGLTHGEAIALGMRGAASLSEDLGLLAPADRLRQDSLLDRLGLPGSAPGLPLGTVIRNIKGDKKVRDHKPRFVLTVQVGSARLAQPVDEARVRRALAPLLT